MSSFMDVPGVKANELDAKVAAKVADGTSATAAQLNATYVPKWKATTAYTAGYAVLNPSGDVVTAKVDFTSGASYDATNWNLSPSYATPATAQGIALVQALIYGA